MQYQQTVAEALKEALAHRSYLLLTTGFFVCGFQVAFITAHFPAYLGDIGIEPRYAVIAMALIGFFNIIGSLAAGWIGQRYSKPHELAFIYIGRSITVTLFLLLPQTPTSVVIFASVMGLLWLSTVPPTNGLVAIMFGTRHLGLLGGLVFLSHQIGSFLGVWMGGYLYDHFGTYDQVWWLGVALGIFAAVVHWPIREKRSTGPPWSRRNFAQSEIIFRHFIHAGSKFPCFRLTRTVTENYFIFLSSPVDGFGASTYLLCELVRTLTTNHDWPPFGGHSQRRRSAKCKLYFLMPSDLADDPVPRDGETPLRLLLSNVTQRKD